MNKLRSRLAFDAVLTALLVFEMFFEVTGDVLHEVVGMVFFGTIVVHLVFSRKWIGAMTKAVSTGKRMKPAAVARMVLGIALAVNMAVLMASSVAISNVLAGIGLDLSGGAYGTWALVHTVSSYSLCCLVVAHLAMHWASIASALRIPFDPERRKAINTGVAALGMVGVAAVGLVGFKSIAVPAAAAIHPPSDAADGQVPDDRQGAPFGNSKPNAGNTQDGRGNRHGKSSKGARSQGESGSSPRKGGQQPDYTPEQESGDSDSYGLNPESRDSGGAESNSGSGAGSGNATGVCTLCRKNCPLSAPLCNKPYEEGLL